MKIKMMRRLSILYMLTFQAVAGKDARKPGL